MTSDSASFARFTAFASRSNLTLAYTDNPRSSHDTWGGWGGPRNRSATSGAGGSASGGGGGSGNDNDNGDDDERALSPTSMQTLVAAVNQHIASFAGVYVGLASSAWTPYLAMFMRGPTQPLGYARTMHYLCCDCRSRDFYGVNNTPANVHMLVAEGSAKEHVHRLELEVVGSRGTEERSGSASSQRCVVHDLRAMRRCSVVHAKPCRNDER